MVVCVKTAMVKVATYKVEGRICGPKNGSVWRPCFWGRSFGKEGKVNVAGFAGQFLGPPGGLKNWPADLYFFWLFKRNLSSDW